MLIRNEAELEAAIDHLRGLDLSKPHRMEIKRQTRSVDQNRLYWYWINDITTFWTTECINPPILTKTYKKNGQVVSISMPWKPKDVHEYFAEMFLLAYEVIYHFEQWDAVVVKRQSTSTLETAPMSDYMMKIRQVMIRVDGKVLVTWEENEFTKYLEKTGGL